MTRQPLENDNWIAYGEDENANYLWFVGSKAACEDFVEEELHLVLVHANLDELAVDLSVPNPAFEKLAVEMDGKEKCVHYSAAEVATLLRTKAGG